MSTDYYAMTFDQLLERQRVLTKKYNLAYNSYASPEVMEQMLIHLDSIKQAMWELNYKETMRVQGDRENGKDTFDDSIV